MKERFLDSVVYNLVDKRNYIPVVEEEGDIYAGKPVRILENSSYGMLTLVEFIDADRLSADGIRERLSINAERLRRVQGSGMFLFLEVFVFGSTPDPERLQIISSDLYQMTLGKRCLACMTVDLDHREVKRHFHMPKANGEVEKAIKEVLSTDYEAAEAVYDIQGLLQRKEKEYNIEFASKVPVLTYILIAVNIAVWLGLHALSMYYGVNYDTLLINYGAKENLGIMAGEYWRFIVPVFFHANIVHLAINCYSLYQLGFISEKLYGNGKFAFIYFTAGIIGNIASFMFSVHPGVGASGAIFGLLGALLYFGIENPTQFRRYFGYSVIIMIFINISYGFSQAGIDNYAHIGGLVGGFLAAGIVQLKGTSRKLLQRPVFIIATVLVVVVSLAYGFTSNQNTLLPQVEELSSLNQAQKWSEAEKLGKEILDKNPKDKDTRLRILSILVISESYLNEYDQAFKYAEDIKQVDQARGYYITGLLYFDTRQYDLAKQALQQAKELDKDLTDAVDKLLTELENIPQ